MTRKLLTLLSVAAACGMAAALGVSVHAAADATPAPTFSKDVAPIMMRSCVQCHRPGQVAPMSLLTYDDARPWARSIRNRVSKREMPPWGLDPTVGIKEILDDPSLSSDEIKTIAAWVDAGAPQGNPNDMPKAPAFPNADTWTIGTPDYVVEAPQWTQPAQGADWFGDFYVDSGLQEDRWIKAVEVLPTVKGRKAVHHTIVYALQDDKDILNNMLPVRAPDGFNPNLGTRLAEYTIGNNGDVYADGTARLIKAGARLHFNAHYHSIGEEVKDRIRVGFIFYPKGYTPKYVLQNKLLSANGYIDLPAGANNVRNDGYFVLPQPTKLLLFQPHMHWRGKAMQLEAIYPNGQVELISSVPHFDSNWQITYAYKNPPVFPAGTVLHQTSYHDNSAANKNNPDPNNWAGGGERTVDEMSIAHIDFIYLTKEDYDAAKQPQSSTQQQQ
jgi:mono/diheme cytochrome c family protein